MPSSTLQVQSDSAGRQVLDAFSLLSEEDQRVLAFEMALTGLAGQTYAHGSAAVGGPAFLVYYSPAFLRSAVRDERVACYVVRRRGGRGTVHQAAVSRVQQARTLDSRVEKCMLGC